MYECIYRIVFGVYYPSVKSSRQAMLTTLSSLCVAALRIPPAMDLAVHDTLSETVQYLMNSGE